MLSRVMRPRQALILGFPLASVQFSFRMKRRGSKSTVPPNPPSAASFTTRNGTSGHAAARDSAMSGIDVKRVTVGRMRVVMLGDASTTA